MITLVIADRGPDAKGLTSAVSSAVGRLPKRSSEPPRRDAAVAEERHIQSRPRREIGLNRSGAKRLNVGPKNAILGLLASGSGTAPGNVNTPESASGIVSARATSRAFFRETSLRMNTGLRESAPTDRQKEI